MKKLLFIIFCFFAISCFNKVKVDELEYKVHGWEAYVFMDNNPFDGVAWSEDGESYKIIVNEGSLERIEYFDSKGDLFCSVEEGEKIYYNRKGKEISRDEARELYNEKYYHWMDQQREIREIVKSHPYKGKSEF